MLIRWEIPPQVIGWRLSGSSLARFVLLTSALLEVPGVQAQVVQPGGRNPELPVRTEDFAQVDYDHELAPKARAVRTRTGIDLDGRLDEPVWTAAPPITEFIQEDPDEGATATERTEFRVAYDDNAMYVGAILHDSNTVTTRLVRRDVGNGDFDYISVSLDSYHDHETAYQFTVNPSGAISDAVSSGGGGAGGGGDSSWDPVWEAATQVTESGWSTEMRIPFSQLRFSPDEKQVWGIEIKRNIHRNQEQVTFPFIPTLERGGASRFAHLEGIEGIEPDRRLELLPYVAGRGEFLQLAEPQGIDFVDPFRSGSDYFAEVGLDLKYRLASNVTLDATVNPDFGQVELDPSVINLTAFETRYEERRPFFVEGGDIFRFGEGGPGGSTGRAPQLFYSRRIGRSPSGAVPSEAIFSDAASATTILGAAKVTGKVGDGWSLGILEAVTAQETVTYSDADNIANESVIEPAANYLVGRMRRQIRGGETRFGLFGTAVNRKLVGTGMDSRLHSAAYSGGADFAHEWSGRMYRISSTFTASYVEGDSAAITRTQRSSTRYYQRPGADRLDPSATSLGGYYGMVDVAKQAGAFVGKLSLAAASPGYEVNDLGFQSASDRIIMDTHFQYNQPNPGRIFRAWDVRWSPDAVWNYRGDRVFAALNHNFVWQLLNYWEGGIRVSYNPPYDDDRLTRGGPIARTPSRLSVNPSFSSDGRRDTVGRLNYQWVKDDAGGWSSDVSLNLTANPSEGLSIQLGLNLTRRYESAQYVTSVEDPLARSTYGSRYVFGGLDQTTVSIDARVNVTFTPTLSLQLYAEPFISTGDYRQLKELERPRAFDFLEYGKDIGTVSPGPGGDHLVDPDGDGPAEQFEVSDRDFSYRSLLGNAVLRWEWRQGSTLYLVWQQSRINSVTGQDLDGISNWVGGFDLGRDVGDMFGTRPDNILVLKLNYWLNP